MPSFIDTITLRHWRAAAFLGLVCLALFLPGIFSLQPMDRDEPRFAQASKQMLETGDFVRIRFQTQARNNKPAGIYWLQAASVSAGQGLGVADARRQIWLYRLPSLAGAIAAVLLTYWTALAFVARGPALLAALLLAATVQLGVEARLAKTDAVLLATIVAAMGAFARMYLSARQDTQKPRDWRIPAIFWTAIGFGLLIKGPITPLVPLLAGIALVVADRGAAWFRRLRLLPGIAWALALALPWFVLILIETKGGFLADSVGKDMLAKVGSGKESHGAPPLTYFAAFWLTAWPMAPLAALAAPFVWKARREIPVRFLLAWLLPLWILFELVPTKLPHYVLPAYPAIAILTALFAEKALAPGFRQLGGSWRSWIAALLPFVAFALTAAGAALAIYTKAWPHWLWFVFAPLAVWLSFAAVFRERPAAARLVMAVAAAFCLYAATFSGILTGGPGQIAAIAPQLASAVRTAGHEKCKDPAIVTAGYYEPSLVFLTRTDLLMADGAHSGRWIADGTCRMALVDIRMEDAFRKESAGAEGLSLVRRVRGVNLNGGKPLDIGVWLRQ
ncbi:MAG: ArnT family glycosyltransferase [Beijerinckiaceae bacterium]